MAENQKEMEARLWDYIDGLASADEHQRVQELIARDQTWRQTHEQLKEVHALAMNAALPEAPSMRFARNVMESIAAGSGVGTKRNYIHPWVVKSIAAFFVMAIFLPFLYMMVQTDWTAGAEPLLPEQWVGKGLIIAETASTVLVPVTILAMLIFADEYRRRKTGLKNGFL